MCLLIDSSNDFFSVVSSLWRVMDLKTLTAWSMAELLNIKTYNTFNIFLINIHEVYLFEGHWPSVLYGMYYIYNLWTKQIKEIKHLWKQRAWNTHTNPTFYLKWYSLKNWAPSHGSLRDRNSSSNITMITISNITEHSVGVFKARLWLRSLLEFSHLVLPKPVR